MLAYRRNIGRAVAALTAAALALVAGCGDSADDDGAARGQATSRPATGAESLDGVCPDTVVVQTNWWPQAEYGGLYRLLGGAVDIDRDAKSVTGPLVSGGVDTGVRVEIRSGGPANNFTPAARFLYLDDKVTLAGSDLDQAAQFSARQPAQAVFAPLDRSPLVLMWDPKTYPDVKTVADVGRTGARVLYFQGATYMEYLTGAGILRKEQVEASYDGTPARFVTERGKAVQQGYLTNEVYAYESELTQWRRPVGWALVNDSGYPNYPEALAIRPDRRAELAPCLRRLVPMLQRSTIDYAREPDATNDLLVRLVKEYDAFPYSADRAAYAVRAMRDNRILDNGASPAIGDFEEARVRRVIEIVGPIFARQGAPLKPGLTPGDLFTNEFIDPALGLA
jgi:hypothetical protein